MVQVFLIFCITYAFFNYHDLHSESTIKEKFESLMLSGSTEQNFTPLLLKLPAAERSGNLHRKEYYLFLICSLTPPQSGRGMRSRFGSTGGGKELLLRSLLVL